MVLSAKRFIVIPVICESEHKQLGAPNSENHLKMKPDQHKKKRSAQYKKKHGMKTSDRTDEANSGKQTRRGKGESGREKPRDGNTENNTSASAPKPTSTSAEEITGGFKHREVASNWDRYEGLGLSGSDGEEEPVRKGAEFQMLLDASSNPMSQFRFQDEKDWIEEDVRSHDVLSLNVEDIAVALSCIPLNEKLNIEPEAFQDCDIQKYSNLATHNLSVYTPRVGSSIEASTAVDIASFTEKIIDNLTGQELEPSDSDDSLTDILTEQPDVDINLASNQLEQITQCVSKKEDDLDGLLKLSEGTGISSEQSEANELSGTSQTPEPVSNSPAIREPPQQPVYDHISKGQMTSIEDQLDQLLSLDDDTNAGQPQPILKTNEVTKDAQKVDNLEDWLDSVLED